MDCNKPIAHVDEEGRNHYLYEHLMDTAKKAAKMAGEFGCAGWGYLAGLWHDLGKYSGDFQAYIQGRPGRVEHSAAGGIYAAERFKEPGRILAYVIAGHHPGLPDWQTENSGQRSLLYRIQNGKRAVLEHIPAEILQQVIPTEKPKPGTDPAFWIRMIFSCLVDADFLDTEEFFSQEKAETRRGYPVLADLLSVFSAYMEQKQREAGDTPVNQLRAKILQQCITKAVLPPAVFTLTVPTGGGKTLSSMAFALHHAKEHNKRRIIYVIPYTSIIEQTADQFRKIFGNVVVEHHSNFDASDDKEEFSRNRLACENWDAPVIVTTSVQFFESLFASRTSRCRKLHNIVNSVVVLDETQLLPPEFLNPIVEALKELQKNYGVTLILSTATQPAFKPVEIETSEGFKFPSIPNMVEIMDNPLSLHNSFQRVHVQVPDDLQTPRTWEDLASELKQHPSVLCIVNRRDDCRELFQLMPEGTIHLSALMCGAHRKIVIDEIKQRLRDNIPTRVISTQLVEAGVDIDFPVVYRALAGLDSIAQAAGRCNREGRMKEKGRVVVFRPPSLIPVGHLRQAGEKGRQLLAEKTDDPLTPERFDRFFKELYWLKGSGLDKHDILRVHLAKDRELRFSFRTAAEKFRLIDYSQYLPVIVNYGKGTGLIEQLKRSGPERWLMRKLQRYVVNLPRNIHQKLQDGGGIMEIRHNKHNTGIYVQMRDSLYRLDVGFCPDKSIVYEPDELMS